MNPRPYRQMVFVVAIALAPTLLAAESAGDDRLRATLRDTMVQLRNAQSDLANLQAAQATAGEEKKALTDKYDALKKQTASERGITDRTLASLSAQLEEQKSAAAKLREALDKEKSENAKLATAGHVSEDQAAKASAENAVLHQQLSDRESRNLALFLLGNEILTRYEEFSLGKALAAKEPFVGKTRTRLENLIQDYQDKLADQRVKP